MTPTPNPTAEQIVRGVRKLLNRYSLRGEVPCDEIDKLIDDSEADLLSEGAPSEEPLGDTVFQFGDDAQAYRAWQAIVDAIPQEVQSDWEAIDYLRTLIRWTLGGAAGVAPQGATGVGEIPVLPTETPESGSVFTDREKLIAEADVWLKTMNSQHSDSLVRDLRDALAAPLDPEKVAEALEQAMRDEAMLFDNGDEEWIAESDPVECLPPLARALCAAYTEGKLT